MRQISQQTFGDFDLVCERMPVSWRNHHLEEPRDEEKVAIFYIFKNSIFSLSSFSFSEKTGTAMTKNRCNSFRKKLTTYDDDN